MAASPLVRRLSSVLLAACACAREPNEPPFEDEREPCADRDPLRKAFFGDLHVHTSYSFDAYLNDVRNDPRMAYRFARGEALALPPLVDGVGTQTVQLDRPLDFAAVTDHGEYLAEVWACVTPESPVFDDPVCEEYRAATPDALAQWGLGLNSISPDRIDEICGAGKVDCEVEAGSVWQEIQDAAEEAYDRSEACEFTSFVGYEWSGSNDLSNLHRNVIFRSKRVPSRPVSHYEAPEPYQLWQQLDAVCMDAYDDCEALAIPHNSNWSNGNLFAPTTPPGMDALAAAQLRDRLEPLVEIYQHKGDSECMNGLSGVIGEVDELCDFEKLRVEPFEDCGDEPGSKGIIGAGCVSRLDYLRGVLIEGLAEQAKLGVNPYRLGVIASTDTHNGTPGEVAEAEYRGNFGSREMDATSRLTGSIPAGPRNSPGGLVGIWAEDNSRESLFDAMLRRETFGTSGPRLLVRFFGGWEYPQDICSDPSLVEQGYAGGVPMGGSLPPASEGAAAPVFVVSALRDPGTDAVPSMPLERVQIIKGWLDADGEGHVEVFDVAGGDLDAGVDPSSCEPWGEGHDSLCARWVDPSWVADQAAFYYVRVLENPVCRWSTRDCNSLPAADRPAACNPGALPLEIQERAWTSPIWTAGA